MRAEDFLNAAWAYWVQAAPDDVRPSPSDLSDDELYRVQLFDAPGLPSAAYAEVMTEWSKRHLRVKVYRDTSPRRG